MTIVKGKKGKMGMECVLCQWDTISVPRSQRLLISLDWNKSFTFSCFPHVSSCINFFFFMSNSWKIGRKRNKLSKPEDTHIEDLLFFLNRYTFHPECQIPHTSQEHLLVQSTGSFTHSIKAETHSNGRLGGSPETQQITSGPPCLLWWANSKEMDNNSL